jgi:hypothetical protein
MKKKEDITNQNIIKHYDVPFDDRHFDKLKEQGISFSMKETFTHINESNLWNGSDSVSGAGSDKVQTAEIARQLPAIIEKYRIKTMLDLPCGDFNWMSRVDLGVEEYIGADIVDSIVQMNREAYEGSGRRFLTLDLTMDELPKADLIFCRDCLVHLSYEDINWSFESIRNAGITYILMTTFTEFSSNHNIVSGDWRPLNFQKAPFNFPEPLELIDEKCTEGDGKFADKSMGLWKL